MTIFSTFWFFKIRKANVQNPAYFSTTRLETRPHEAHFYVLTPCPGKSWKKMSEIRISDIFHVRNHVRNLPPCMCGAPRIMTKMTKSEMSNFSKSWPILAIKNGLVMVQHSVESKKCPFWRLHVRVSAGPPMHYFKNSQIINLAITWPFFDIFPRNSTKREPSWYFNTMSRKKLAPLQEVWNLKIFQKWLFFI